MNQDIVTPNTIVRPKLLWTITGVWFVLWLAYWIAFRPVIFPSPVDIIRAIPSLWFEEGLGQELLTSLRVNLEALFLSTVIGLPLAYLSRVPLFRPVALAASTLRFLSPVVFFLLLLFITGGGHAMKVVMLTLGEVFFLTTSMITVVNQVPSIQLDDARTLRMNEWQVLWYSVVRGTLPQTFDAIRDNAAMGFSMLLMVESILRSERGLGVLVSDQEKHMNFAEVYAVVGVILLVGWSQDRVIGWLRRGCCPYVETR